MQTVLTQGSFWALILLPSLSIAELHGGNSIPAENDKPTKAQACTLQPYITAFHVSGQPETKEVSEGKLQISTFSWQECFEQAQKMADRFEAVQEISVCNRITGSCVNTNGYVSYSWKFNDGYLLDSKGEITAYTKLFRPGPAKGSLRFLPSGNLF